MDRIKRIVIGILVCWSVQVELLNCMFLTSPVDTIGYDGQTVDFHCSIDLNNHYEILWYVTDDYIFFGVLPVEYGAETFAEQTGSVLSVTLTLRASALTNNTLVTCYSTGISSDARLKVQGLLASPSDLTHFLANETLTLKWMPLFKLEGSEIMFKITVVSDNRSDSLTTSHDWHTFTFHQLNISQCELNKTNSITFTVQPLNPAGVGEPATMVIPAPCGVEGGKLDAPTNVTGRLVENNVLLSWQSPFTLSLINYYFVEVSSLQYVVTKQTTPVSSHSFSLDELDIDLCVDVVVTVRVWGVNHAGQGEIANTSISLTCPTSIVTMRTTSTSVTVTEHDPHNNDMDRVLYISVSIVLALSSVLVVLIIITFVFTLSKKKYKKGSSQYAMEPNDEHDSIRMKLQLVYNHPLA